MIFPAIVAIVIFLVFMAVVQRMSKQEGIRERMQRMATATKDSTAEAQAEETLLDPLREEQELSGLGAFCDGMLRLLGSDTETFRKNSQIRFYRSGLTSANAPIFYLFYKRIGVVFMLALAAWMIYSGTQIASESLAPKLLYFMMGGMVIIAAFFGADLFLENLRTKREKLLLRSFPDALDLLLVCVESGLALDGALSRVCKELGRAHPAITQELNRTRLELTLLNDRSQALTNLAERTDMVAFRSLVTTLLQSERFGTSLTDTLRVLSEDYRNFRLMAAEDKAGRLPVMITIPLITLMMPALFLIILGPAMLSVVHVLNNR